MSRIRELVSFMTSQLDPADIEAGARCVMADMYIRNDVGGCYCILTAVCSFYSDPEQSFTKELYVNVGHILELDWQLVEKQIRYAIAMAWRSRSSRIWRAYFPYGRKPSNAEFITRVAEILQIWQDSVRTGGSA